LLKVAKAVFVLAGDQGDILLTQSGKEIWLPRFQVEAVDETGAGDAFLGTLATKYLSMLELKRQFNCQRTKSLRRPTPCDSALK